jgi:hypothetical protein
MTSQQIKPITVIGGSGSSGSTLLATVLDRHPEIYCAPELSLFNKRFAYTSFPKLRRHFWFWLWRGVSTDGYLAYSKLLQRGNLEGLSRDTLLHIVSDSQDFRQFALGLRDELLRAHKKRVFVEKTPSNVYCFPEFARTFPDGQMIHLFRDGRDAVASLRNRGWSLFKSASTWVYNVASGIACRGLPQYSEIRYEDLVSEPRAILERICSTLGVEYLDEVLHRPRDPNCDRKQIPTWSLSPADPISTASIGRHKSDLSEPELACFYRVSLTESSAEQLGVQPYSAAELLDTLGYPTAAVTGQVPCYRRYGDPLVDLVRRNAYHFVMGEGLRHGLTKMR